MLYSYLGLFSSVDTLKISQDGIADIPVHKDGIAWPTDKRSKFKNPADWVDKKCQSEGESSFLLHIIDYTHRLNNRYYVYDDT